MPQSVAPPCVLKRTSDLGRSGSQTEEPSGGGRRSCAIKGGQGVGLPVHKAKPLWPLPSTRLSIISSTAALQVNKALFLTPNIGAPEFIIIISSHYIFPACVSVCVCAAYHLALSLSFCLQGPCWVRLSRPCPATAPCQFSHLESRLDIHHSSAPSKLYQSRSSLAGQNLLTLRWGFEA